MAEERVTSIIERLGTVPRRTYKSEVHEVLYTLIQKLALPPGERLVEDDLAARFGVSKTPIREALLMLEQQNLVTIVPHAGATVTGLSLENYEQHLFLLDALEQPALPLVVERITPDEVVKMAALIELIEQAHARRDGHAYDQLVGRMHTQLFMAARYPVLMELITTVMVALRRYHLLFILQFVENWNREVAMIAQRFAHLRAGDPAAAAAVVKQGHAEMFAFARQRVKEQDPTVWHYLSLH